MQRQSLGSPGRPTLPKNDAVFNSDDTNRRRKSSLPATFTGDEIKPEKPIRSRYSPEKLVHMIPILLVLCFLALYLCSHNPTSTELAQFSVFKHPEKLTDSTDIDEIGRVLEDKLIEGRGEIFAIRSLRNLQEEIRREDVPEFEYRSHRKLGDF